MLTLRLLTASLFVIATCLGPSPLGFSTNAHAAEFPTPYDSQKTDGNPLTPAAEALTKFQLPPGFTATLFASEPQVRNPIAMTFDARGRLWVAENYTYAEAKKNFDTALSDRIVVFHDDDGDGKSEKQVVFADTLKRLTSVELGFGGVYALCPPQLLFIPDANRDDVPDGVPQVLLDGFDFGPVRHNIANGLKWGPDGWLYGRHGIQAVSKVGAPGTSDDQRVKVNCAIWRFHPVTKAFEVVADGTTNSWGMDWDQHGEAFFINTVIGHLWHLIPGAHYRRMYGEDLDPTIYGVIEQHADHVHWATGEKWNDTKSDKITGSTSAAGGGHAHSGLMIYQGGNWPADYANKLFTINFHGTRLNQEILERHGSGYVGRHAPDLLQTTDKWFRGVELISGPEGAVYVADWSDIGECHDHDGVHRGSGRIYRFAHGNVMPAREELPDSPTQMLAALGHPNIWVVRRALQVVRERAAAGVDQSAVVAALRPVSAGGETVARLRALWALNAAGAADATVLLPLVADPDEYVRRWAIRLITDAMPLYRQGQRSASNLAPAIISALTQQAEREKDPSVRLVLASTLQRLPHALRPALAGPLLSHSADATDHNLPLMYWYGVKVLATTTPAALVSLATSSQVPLVRRNTARRLAELSAYTAGLDDLLVAATAQPMAFRTDVLAGMVDAFKGVRKAAKPSGWDALVESLQTNTDPEVGNQVRELHTVFGDGRALAATRRLALDPTVDLGQRRAALQSLIDNCPDDLRSVCEHLLQDRDLNVLAARGLSQFDDPAIGALLVKNYRRLFRANVRPEVLAVLVSRASFARNLLANVGDGADQIPRGDILPFHARTIRNFKDKELTKQLTAVWGVVRDSSEDKVQLIAALKQQLTPEVLAKGDQSQGRMVYTTLCASCHQLYGEGGRIGPDLTGAGRHDLSYILDNVVDPSGVVAADFRLAILTLKDGRVLSGLIPEQSERTVALQTMTERVTIEKSEITDTQLVNQSLMPEGLFQTLTDTQVRDLVAYLMSTQQVPLP